MKICCKGSLLRLRNSFIGKFCWIKVFLFVLIWICCCYQGDDARPLTISSVTLECHVILEESFRKYVQLTRSCKCWIWCRTSNKCAKWNLFTNASLTLVHSSQDSPLREILATTYNSCCESDHLNEIEFDFECIESQGIAYSSHCNIDSYHGCCFVLCGDHQGVCTCIQLDLPNNGTQVLFNENEILSEIYKASENKVKDLFDSRPKRSSDFVSPYRIEVSENLREIAVLQPFQVSTRLLDNDGSLVVNLEKEVVLNAFDSRQNPLPDLLQGKLTTNFIKGQANFSNIIFLQTGSSYKLSVSSTGSPEIIRWFSDSITVTERPLFLRPSGRTLPISPRENDTLSPAAGVVIYDVLNDAPANRTYLSKFTFEGSIGLLYDDIYPGTVLGSTFQLVQDGSNEILFNDIIISRWGYSYIFVIKLRSRETSFWNLTCLIGPFDVDMLDSFELPLIESEEFRRVQIVFDGNFQRVQEDRRKFEIFFLNFYGMKYPKVRWQNVTLSEGSVVVDAVITGLTEDLEKTSEVLADDIGGGRANIQYEGSRTWRANRVSVPSRKLLEESANAESQTSEEGGGGLSVAWIVAIVINVVLIIFFIIAIIYCWLRRKKNLEGSRTGSAVKNFDGKRDEMMFTNKDAIKKKSMEEKAALMESGRTNNIFTVEDGRRQMHDHSEDERCNCYSPRCYCSVGDGIKLESRLDRSAHEENEDDPRGYPNPSPQPTFPTPEPSPDPEDYWRPDSFQQGFKEEEEEEEEDEDMFLPGAVTEPEPEGPREERFYIYHVTDIDGSRELFGQVYLPVDSFLNDVRRIIDRDRDLSDAIRKKEYRFLDENLDSILTYQESSLDLERVFPSQEINIQYTQQVKENNKEPQVSKMPKIPAYVGPLGICSASDCTKAAKIKCLDCRNTAYCSKRCMMEDVKEHRRACYKPAWRL